jgi:hypothetical protein
VNSRPLERSLQKSVLNHLKKLRQQDPTLVYRKRHGTALGKAGDPDIYGVWGGIHFEIELKAPGEEPTPLQRARHQEWGRAGGLVFILHSVVELPNVLDRLICEIQNRLG